MSINLGTYALVSALAVGGADAQYQYSQPAGPQDPNTAGEQSVSPGQPGDSDSVTGAISGEIDCNTLMTSHQQMLQELDAIDRDVELRLNLVRDAKDQTIKLDATVGR